jgi:superoxide dismutase, Cu-Zn family
MRCLVRYKPMPIQRNAEYFREITMTTRNGLWLAGLAASAFWLVTPAAAQSAKATLKDQKGAEVGVVDLTQTPAGVMLRLSLKGLPAGERAFHIHAIGRCEAPFTTAGGHFNPGGQKHGLLVGPGHAGDMPNLHVPAGGALVVEILNAAVTLEKGKPNSLFHSGGTSIVIHAGKDDYKSDPAGNAGDRIACGVIE